MKVLAVRYAADVEKMQEFYGLLGLTHSASTSTTDWREMWGDGVLAIHTASTSVGDHAPVEFCLEAEEPLETIQDRLRSAGFDPGLIRAEDFGRSLRVKDPDGFDLQINGQ